MKTVLLFSFGIIFPLLTAQAQITVDSSDFLQPGTVIILATDTAPLDISISPGNSGPNQIWDFSALVADEMDTLSGKLPSQSAGNTFFPSANLAVEQSGQPNMFMKLRSSQFMLDGVYGDVAGTGNPIPVDYNPDKKLAVFPATYLTAFNDTNGFDVKTSVNQFPIDSVRQKHIEYVYAQIDGYGLLKTPHGTFEVLREYDQILSVDSIWARVFGSWSFYQAVVSNKEAYSWVAKDAGWLMADMQFDTSGNITSVNCIYYPPIDSATISQPVPSCDILCDETATVVPAGGTPPYIYEWSNGDSTATADSLCAGTYYVTVSDFTSNFIIDSIVISDPGPISANIVITDATCNNVADGSVDQTVSGGTSPYLFNWSNGSTAEDPSALASGIYYLTITDANNCTMTDSAEVLEIIVIAVSIDSINNSTCNGIDDGAIYITATGGTNPYSYEWSNLDTTEDITGLSEGAYTVLITDGNGCTTVAADTVDVLSGIIITLDSILNINCSGSNNGAIYITASGGTGALSSLWSNSATTHDITGLTAGSYTDTVSDPNGCVATLTVSVGDVPAVSATAGVTNVSCNGGSDGSVNLTPANGSGAFSYLWSEGSSSQDISGLSADVYNVTVVDTICFDTATVSVWVNEPAVVNIVTDSLFGVSCNGNNDGAIYISATGGNGGFAYVWNTAATSNAIAGLAPATYTVTATDSKGCSDVDSFDIAEPAVLTVGFTSTGVSCPGSCDGTATANTNGGTTPYTYAWSFGLTSSTATAMFLCTGAGDVTITDVNGCIAIDSFTVGEPAAISVAITTTGTKCNGSCDGTATPSASGGTAPYIYTWSSGNGLNLCAGDYTVTITDSNGCTVADTATITEPQAMSALTMISNVTCNGQCNGTADIFAVFGGTWPYSYSWSNGDNTSAADSLCAGNHTVAITDSTGCTDPVSVTIAEPTPLSIDSITSTDETAQGAFDGTVAVYVTQGSGTPPYNYVWDDPASQADSVATGLATGWYTVKITDASGCTLYDSVFVDLITGIRCYTDGSKRIRIFPLPANEYIVVENGSRSKTLHILLRDASGKKVAEHVLSGVRTHIQMSKLSGGIYLLEADDMKGNILMRINIPVAK